VEAHGELQAALTWVGHATVLLELDDLRVLTDPVLRDRVGPLVRVAESAGSDEIGPIDLVLLSHLHADHTDLPSLRRLTPAPRVLAPYPAAAWLTRRGLQNATDLSVGEQRSIGSVRIAATQAMHDRRRRPLGPAADPVGYVVRGSRSVYFAGDTDLSPEMSDLRGSIDVALLPVWGWGKSVGPGHLDPVRASRAAALIAPAIAIPVHWGTFRLRSPTRRQPDLQRPAREFAELTRRCAPATEVRVLTPGERTVL
jgi:L-ascorbate metabolism protein UlaG (beta-lactamase superfamily)